jgi:hypothetical protein
MDGKELLRTERTDVTRRRRWVELAILAAIALALVTNEFYPSQAATPIQQIECDASGRPAFGILPQDVGAVDIYYGNILTTVGCTSDSDLATPQGTPVSVYDHGLAEPKAMH